MFIYRLLQKLTVHFRTGTNSGKEQIRQSSSNKIFRGSPSTKDPTQHNKYK